MCQTINRTFKEINQQHDMICIEEVVGIQIRGNAVLFDLNGSGLYESDDFDTEEEALEFRNEIMGWNNE